MVFTLLATAGRILHRLIQDKGLDADALYLECGLDPAKLDDAKARYPVDQMRTLWHLAQQRIPDPCWGLAAGKLWRPTDYHALGYAFMASRTLEEALIRLARYYRIVTQDTGLQITINQDSLSVTSMQRSTEADIATLQDAHMSLILEMCREVYGPGLPLLEVQLSHPWQSCDYEHYFGCPVRYDDDSSGLTFALSTVRKKLPAGNLDLANESDRILADLDAFLSGPKLTHRVRQEICRRLPSGNPSAKDVARELALAPRTLQRKLREEGTTYKKVSEDVRKEVAQRYLKGGRHPLSEVTFLTGFSNQPAFSRAYKAWTGRSPSADQGPT
ncbi:AraC family transcriptional regulator [uncultured Thiodictyon sp.]|uniref:AraC family transcriptional regulator n=1 Tax=uncultured Thiodictyon sp. TaxID=1846217 RepID=UPI0025F2A7A9|nr:AraC family transcriptional regulator [uncultured Thiodictyon sp.]